jgi:3-oxoacyl-[acyl-carrier protein] reductase
MTRVALITGGTSGIGEATAKELAKRGWQVAAMARSNVDKAFQGDVAIDADCRRVARAVLDKWGRIDALVNNAGTTKAVPHTDLEGLSGEDFQRIMQINLVGPFQMARACAAALKASKGAIVNVSSVAAVLGTGSSIAYAASKAALNTMTFSLARVLAPEVRVNCVCPGHTNTPWHVAARGAEGAAEVERRYASLAPLKAASEPGDVADAIVWLIEGAKSVTGEVIFVDGGMHVATPR